MKKKRIKMNTYDRKKFIKKGLKKMPSYKDTYAAIYNDLCELIPELKDKDAESPESMSISGFIDRLIYAQKREMSLRFITYNSLLIQHRGEIAQKYQCNILTPTEAAHSGEDIIRFEKS